MIAAAVLIIDIIPLMLTAFGFTISAFLHPTMIDENPWQLTAQPTTQTIGLFGRLESQPLRAHALSSNSTSKSPSFT